MPNYRMVKEATEIAADSKDNKATWSPTGEVFLADTPEAAQAAADAKRKKYPERGCYGCELIEVTK